MDADFSHPPELITKMIEHIAFSKNVDLVVASRYMRGGKIEGWSLNRRLISLAATKIAEYGLGVKTVKDSMSGFFAIRRNIINEVKFDAIGCKILLEVLLKAKLRGTVELPYTFTDRREGKSKLSTRTIVQYLKACQRLASYKHKNRKNFSAVVAAEKKASLPQFGRKIGKFYLVGASGLLVNYGSSLLSQQLFGLYYLHATLLGITISIMSNFFLNKFWTFKDRDMRPSIIARQGSWYLTSSIGGIAGQIGLIYYFVEELHVDYLFSLGLAVILASAANFVVTKKLAFKERLLA